MKGFARMEEEYDAHKENMMDAEKDGAGNTERLRSERSLVKN